MTSLADILSDRKELSVKINGFPVTLWYRPNRITMAENDLVQKLADAGDTLAVSKRFVRQVAEWDLTGPLFGAVIVEPESSGDDEDDADADEATEIVVEERQLVDKGEVIPLDAEIVQHIGQEALLAFMRAIQEDSARVPTSRKAKPSGSRRRG